MEQNEKNIQEETKAKVKMVVADRGRQASRPFLFARWPRVVASQGLLV